MLKKLSRKYLAIAVALCLLLITACSSEKGSTGVNQPDGNNHSPTSNKEDDKSEYVIKILTQDANLPERSDDTVIGKIIKEKFNIVFEYVQSPGNSVDKLNLMLVGKDYPEIIAIQDTVTFDKYARAGALLPLDDFVSNSPEFAERYKIQIPLWRLSGHDGKLYKWEGSVPVDFENNVEVNDVGVRMDLLEQQGWPSLISTDDYIAFLKQALKDNPTVDGQKTVGMAVPFAEPWGIQGISPIMYEKGGRYTAAAGNLAVIWNQVEKQFEDMMMNEYTKESLVFFNQLYREGILDKDAFTDKGDQVQEKLNSGRALSVWYIVWGLGEANQNAIKSGNPANQYINMPIRTMTQVERNEKRQIRVEDTRAHATYGITKNAKHPERIMELLAWAATEEGKILLQSGIEGEHYTIEGDKRVPTEAYLDTLTDSDAARDIGFTAFHFLGYVLSNAPDGVPYTMSLDPKIQDSLQLSPEEKNAFEKLGWKNSKDYYLQTGEAANTGIAGTIALDTTSELGALQQKMVEFRVKNSAKLIVDPKTDEEFEATYQAVISEYNKLNPDRVIEEYNRLYTEKEELLAEMK